MDEKPRKPLLRRPVVIVALCVLAGSVGVYVVGDLQTRNHGHRDCTDDAPPQVASPRRVRNPEKIRWQVFSETDYRRVRFEGRPCLISFIGSTWTPIAVQHKMLIQQSVAIQDLIARNGVIPILADCDGVSDEDFMWSLLRAVGAEQVPTTVLYSSRLDASPIVLTGPETEEGFVRALRDVGPLNLKP